MERNDCLSRIIRTNYILSFDTASTDFSWKEVIGLCAPVLPETVSFTEGDTISALNYLIADTRNVNSVKVLVSRTRENARGVQDNITKEVWEQVNQLYHMVNDPALLSRIGGPRLLDMLDQLEQSNTLYYGVTDNTMPRGQGWNFMNLGKFIERFILTIDTMHAHFSRINHQMDAAQDILFWRNLLLSLSGYELYLKKYTLGRHTINVLDHVIFNKDFPRSLIYSLTRIRRYLRMINEDNLIAGSEGLEKSFGRIFSKVEFADMNTIQETGLLNYLHSLRAELIAFSNQLTRIYFSYA